MTTDLELKDVNLDELALDSSGQETALQKAEKAMLFVVDSDDTYVQAGEMAVDIQTAAADIEKAQNSDLEPWQEVRRHALQQMNKIKAVYSPLLDKLKPAKKQLEQRMSHHRAEQKKKAEQEAAEAQAKAELEAKEREEKMETVAAALEEKGLKDEAAGVRAQAKQVTTVAPVQAYSAPAPKVKGLALSTKKKAKVDERIQRDRLTVAIAEWNMKNPERPVIPGQYWSVNQELLDATAEQTDGMIAIPGVQFYDEEGTTARKR